MENKPENTVPVITVDTINATLKIGEDLHFLRVLNMYLQKGGLFILSISDSCNRFSITVNPLNYPEFAENLASGVESMVADKVRTVGQIITMPEFTPVPVPKKVRAKRK